MCIHLHVTIREKGVLFKFKRYSTFKPLDNKRGGGCVSTPVPKLSKGLVYIRVFKMGLFCLPWCPRNTIPVSRASHQNSSILFCRYFNIESIPCAEPQIFFKTSHSFSFACSKSTFMTFRTKALDSSSTWAKIKKGGVGLVLPGNWAPQVLLRAYNRVMWTNAGADYPLKLINSLLWL